MTRRQLDRYWMILSALFAVIAAAFVGCASPQRAAYQIVGATGVTARAAMQGWAAWCNTGAADADEIRAVEKAYRAYAAAYHLAVDAGKAAAESNNAAALTTAVKVLAACESDLVQLILALLPAGQAAALKGP